MGSSSNNRYLELYELSIRYTLASTALIIISVEAFFLRTKQNRLNDQNSWTRRHPHNVPAPPSAVRDYRTGEGRGANPGRGVRVRVAGMVFENLLAPLLERFLGQYIVDLPREQLRVGVWSGVVRLENVRLKPAAFDHLKLPFAVREGTIGLVELKLALKTVLLSARQHPFVITLDAISVTASPRTEDEWAAEPAARRALALKRAALAAAADEIAAMK